MNGTQRKEHEVSNPSASAPPPFPAGCNGRQILVLYSSQALHRLARAVRPHRFKGDHHEGMGLVRAAQLLSAVLAICGESETRGMLGATALRLNLVYERFHRAAATTRLGQARTLQQSSACITSTTTVDYTTAGLASDPYCLKVGEQRFQ